MVYKLEYIEAEQMKINLVEFSEAVRESSMKRFRNVPHGYENWTYLKGKMSFSDLVQHLIDADNDLFERLVNKKDFSLGGNAGAVQIKSRTEYEALLVNLENSGVARKSLIEGYDDEDFKTMIYDRRFGENKSAWWILVRGNLDHEIHHRGQLSVYLNLVTDR